MMKRGLDIALAAFGLVILSPILLVIAVLVKAFDFGPVFFVQERVGRGGRNFRMLKFRSMVVNAESQGGQITASGDKRITRLGYLLRRTKADELPQLWNVLRGEMSFVGPRPEVRSYVDLYTSEQCKVLELCPGITDLASFAFFNESDLLAAAPDPERLYRNYLIPEKIRINMAYAAQAGMFSDLLLIVGTVLRSFGLKLNLFAFFSVEPPRAEVRP
jgi:lipopolysaccharide/colanic/teichoic acid biosynthesis glycosyltransferase